MEFPSVTCDVGLGSVFRGGVLGLGSVTCGVELELGSVICGVVLELGVVWMFWGVTLVACLLLSLSPISDSVSDRHVAPDVADSLELTGLDAALPCTLS